MPYSFDSFHSVIPIIYVENNTITKEFIQHVFHRFPKSLPISEIRKVRCEFFPVHVTWQKSNYSIQKEKKITKASKEIS